ncbi:MULTISPECIES: ComEC/Rec2 family competence protein [Olivibacter]|uniref:ComEC/Rec2 family competence protein n=1 Tax=Olivibacter oleidegradans TaxID=760123 RepID=A0ABV6HMR8_9SPHI|nr:MULTISPECIES: MBL fold metallo-hydrolase [Olivibacter]MDX3915455.1 MBL fold metallo-hydrolase [Pseudosphingobacterium sp.]QEL02904.1 MBL fold metallo-hydrolase [Olivibacter sp. LS-1]
MTIKINLRLCMQVFCRCMLNPSFPNQGKVMMLSLLLTILNLAKTTAQTLEIHQMSVGHGDAALVVVRDTAKVRQAIIAAGQTVPADRTDMLQLAVDSSVSLNGTVVNAVLIDGGDGSKQANKINFYMTKMGIDSLNYMIASHYHQDHIGGLPGVLVNFNSNKGSWDRGLVKPLPSSTTSNKSPSVYGKYVKAVTKAPMTRNTTNLATTLNLFGTGKKQIQLLCVATNNYVLGDTTTKPAPRSGSNQNDLGLAWILQYGNFRFYSAGDLGGWKSGGYIDMESPLAEALKANDQSNFKWVHNGNDVTKGHVCSFKLSHHGSTISTSEYFLSLIKPITGLISCGDKHGHPNEEVIEALDTHIYPKWDISSWTGITPDSVDNSLQRYFLTSLMDGFTDSARVNIGNPAKSNGVIAGDIVVIVNDEDIEQKSRFTVFWNGELPGTMVSHVMRTPNAEGNIKMECHEVKTNNADLVYFK